MVVQTDPAVRDGTSAGKSDHGRCRRLAGVSLLFGILSIPLAFLFIPGAIAVFYGYRARKVRVHGERGELVPLMGFGAMCLGFVSFLLGVVMLSSLPTTSIDWTYDDTTRVAGVALQSGVENFYSEYGRMPVDDERVTTDSEGGANLLRILLGMEKRAPEAKNPRNIKFLAVREVVARKNGVVYGEAGIPVGMFDAYGNAYTVFLIREGEGSFRFQFVGQTVELEGRRAAVVSPGKDGKLGTSDDIKSW